MEVKVDYQNQEARLCVDMDNTAETYLKRGITKENFFNFVNQIVEMMDKCIKYNLNAQFDLDKMAVEDDVIFFRTSVGKSDLDIQGIKSYLKELAYKSVFQGDDFLQTLYEYLFFLDSAQVNTIDAIKRHLNICINGSDEQDNHEVKQEPVNNAIPVRPAAVPVNVEPAYRPGNIVNNQVPQNVSNNVFEEDDYAEETGVLNPEFWNGLMQKNAMNDQPGRVQRQTVAASLFYMKTGERLAIDKANFTLGKGTDMDYTINNPSISRQHARVLGQNGHYFLIDNASTNGTYVNGRKIEPNTSVEIKNGDLLRFANEEMKFFVG